MKLGRVAGTVVSTISHPIYDGRRLLMCDLLDADGLGGKAYALFSGTVSDVEAAVAIAVGVVPPASLSGSVVIPMLHDEMGANLFDSFRFGTRVGWEGFDAAG